MHFRTIIALAVCIGISTAVANGHAASRKDLERASARATEGKAYFKSKLFNEAAEAFMDAYAIAKKPALVYNAARAHEEMADNKRALALFTMYVSLESAPRDGKKAARKRLKKLRLRIAATQAKEDAERKKRADAKRKAEKDAKRKAEKDAEKDAGRDAAGSGDGGKGSAGGRGVHSPDVVFPVWRLVGGGAIGLFAVAAQLNALGEADNARLKNLGAKSNPGKAKAARDAAQLWQGVAIGSGVVAAGLIGWASWGYFVVKKARKPAMRALWVAPAGPGGWQVGATFAL